MLRRSTFLLLILVLPIAPTRANDVAPAWTRAGGPKSPMQQFCELHLQWVRIHTEAARRGQPVRANIVFDPQSGTVRIERGTGITLPADTIELPSGMVWRGFQVSVHGITKLSFPVILQRPHHYERRYSRDDEEIWIFGESKNVQVHFQAESRTTGPSAGGGGGWNGRLGTVRVRMPQPGDADRSRDLSMLVSPTQGRPAEFIASKGVRIIEVMRESAQ